MNQNLKGINKQKHQFKSYYCLGCKQRKPCQLLTGWDSVWKDKSLPKSYCCSCYYQSEQERAKEYSNHQQIYQRKAKESKEHIQQLQLLKSYPGCQQCGSLAVDAYSLYENSQLVCQPCLMIKEKGASSPISFQGESQWYKRYWQIDLAEWLENYQTLPTNANCARKWQGDNRHLNNCQCLEQEAKENYLLFTNSLKRDKKRLEKECKCEASSKPRTPYYGSDNCGYTYCEKCEKEIKGAGKHGVIKNRNNTSFWGLNIREKVLCLNCLGKFTEKMPLRKKYLFSEYQKRGY